MKTLKHIIGTVIWSLVTLYVIVICLTHIPFIQTKIGDSVASVLGEKLGTKVEVGSVNLGFLNRLIIDDVLIYDQKSKELAKIGRLSVKIEWSALVQGRISIASAQLFGAQMSLYRENADSPLNAQFAIDSLASKDTTNQSPIDLRVNSLIIRHSSVAYNQLDAPTSNKLDTRHMKFSNISAHVRLKHYSEDSLNLIVKRIAFMEQSGLNVKHLSFLLNYGNEGANLHDFSLQLPKSELKFDSIVARRRATEDTAFKTTGIQADIALQDMKFLLPALAKYDDNLKIATKAYGSLNDIEVETFDVVSTNKDVVILGNGRISGLKRQNQNEPVRWNAEVENLNISARALTEAQREIGDIPEFLKNTDGIRITGTFAGDEQLAIKTNSLITSGVGALHLNFQISKNDIYEGHLKSSGIDLKKLFDNEQLGMIAMSVDVSGSRHMLKARGIIDQFDYNSFSYNNIELNGSYTAEDILRGNNSNFTAMGKLKIDDEFIKIDTDGEWKQKNKQTTMKLVCNVGTISPAKLNLSNKWGDAVFSGRFATDISASNINDAQGSIDLYDFAMADSSDVYRIESVKLKSGFEEGKHFLNINGDMGSIALTGQFDWDTLPQSFINAIGDKLPTLPGLPKLSRNVTNDFDIALNIVDSKWLQRLFNIPIELDKPLVVKASINDINHEMKAEGGVAAFVYNGNSYSDALINLQSPQDSVKCNISVVKAMDDGTNMDIAAMVNAYDNQLQTCFTWDNHANETEALRGRLNAIAQLYTDDEGKAEAHVHFEPSHTTIGGATWNIVPSDIFYSDKNIVIEHFSVEHALQHLTINGTVSNSINDTLTVDLMGVDVRYVLDLVNFHPVDFDGKATGKAYITSVFDTPVGWADITVEDFLFEKGRMGTLHAKALWNQIDEQIDIDAVAEDGPDVKTIINGYVSPIREDISLNIEGQGTYIDFLQKYTKSFLSGVTGHAYGNVRLVGPLGEMDLLGTLAVDAQAKVIPLGTTYTLNHDIVKLVPNDILIENATFTDCYGNKGTASGGIHHDHLSSLTFDIDFATDKLLVYDFKDYGDEIFCGTVYASGTADIHGRPTEIVINSNATPLRGTTFYYNAASTGNVSKQEFITWKDKEQSADGSTSGSNKDNSNEAGKDIPTNIFMNFIINATPEASMRLLMDEKTNDYINLYGNGSLHATYHNHGAFHLFGTYTVDHGTYGITIQNIIKKNFLFNEGGTIIFGGNPMDANLQLQATYTVNGVSLSDLNIGNSFSSNTIRVNCLMNIYGQAGSPRVEFDLDMPTVNSEEKQMIRSVITNEQEMNQQVLYLLGIGRFYTQGINNASATEEYGQTELAMQSFLSGTLSTQINEVISQVIKDDNWNFGANISTGNEGWHNAEYEGIVSGRMLNNRLLINGQFGYRDNATQATPSFIGDFDLRYLLQPNGNLALKVYNQTNDRYFTRSALNTQGIGIIVKRDFYHIKDLLLKKKKQQQ